MTCSNAWRIELYCLNFSSFIDTYIDIDTSLYKKINIFLLS